MSVFKRAWLYVTRKRKKSLIMLLILFGMSTAVLSGIAIRKATSVTEQSMKQGINAGFELSMFDSDNSTTGMLTDQMIEKVSNIKGVKSYNRRLLETAGTEDVEYVQVKNRVGQYDSEYEALIKDALLLSGNDYSELDPRFVTGMVKLIEGRHITKEDRHKLIISKDLAEKNNLQIGSKISINVPKALLESSEPKSDIVLEVVGIFEVLSQDGTAALSHLDLVENSFITDLTTVKEYKGVGEQTVYNVVNVAVEDPKQLDSIVKQVKQLPINWKNNQLIKNEDVYEGLSGSLDAMNDLVNMMIMGCILISILILVLILTFWIQGRIHETGILISLGISKWRVISQYILELLFIAIVSFGLSCFSANMIAQTIGEKMLEKAGTQSQQQILNGFGGFSLSGDPESSAVVQTIKHIEVAITAEEIINVSIIGVGIIVVAVILASLSIFRLQPKQILSQMS